MPRHAAFSEPRRWRFQRGMHMYAGRNVATLEAVEGLLQREANGASEQPVVCTHSEDQQILSGQPLAHQALSILQQSLDRHSWRRSSSGGHHSTRELTQRVQ